MSTNAQGIAAVQNGAAANPTSGNFDISSLAWLVGDVAIFVWYSRDSTKTFTKPTNATTSVDTASAGRGHLWVGYRVLVAGDSTFGWTGSSVTNGTTLWGVAIHRGVYSSGNPVEASSGANATALDNVQNMDPPAVVVATTGAIVIAFFGKNNDYGGTFSVPANMNALTNANAESTLGTDGSYGWAYKQNASIGSFDPSAFTLGGAGTDDGLVWTASLRPKQLGTFTLDAIVKKNVSSSFTINAIVKKNISPTISYVDFASAASTSVSLPAAAAPGDLALVLALNVGSGTPPSLPAGWTAIDTSSPAAMATRYGFRVLVAGDTTTGVWTNATDVAVVVYRGAVRGWGTILSAGPISSISRRALNAAATSSNFRSASGAWGVHLTGHSAATNTKSVTTSSYTTRSAAGGTAKINAGDTNALMTGAIANETVAVDASGQYADAHGQIYTANTFTIDAVVKKNFSSSFTINAIVKKNVLGVAGGEFPRDATTVTDNFNRADEDPIGAPWVPQTAVLSGNQLSSKFYGAGDYSGSTEWSDTQTGDFEVIIELGNTLVGSASLEVTLDGFWDALAFNIYAGGAVDVVSQGGGGPWYGSNGGAAGDLVGFRRIGGVIQAWYKPVAGSWTLIAAYSSTYETGFGGGDALTYRLLIVDDDELNTLDNFRIADFTGPTTGFTIDAYIAAGLDTTGDFTLDAIVKKERTGSFTIDAITKKAVSASFTINAIVKKNVLGVAGGEFPRDATTVTDDFNRADENPIESPWFDYNDYWGPSLGQLSVGAFTIQDTDGGAYWETPHTDFEAVIALTGAPTEPTVALGLASETQSASIQVDNPLGQVSVFVTGAGPASTYSGSIDVGDLLGIRRIGGTFQAWRKVGPEPWLLIAQRYSPVLVGGSVYTSIYIADAAGTTLDNFRIADFTGPTTGFTLDAIVKKNVTATFTLDAIVRAAVAGSFTVDAVVRKSVAASFTVDAWIKQTRSSGFATDAVVRASRAGSFAVDAITKASRSSTLTVDAVVRKVFSATATVDAVVRATRSSSFTSDAIVQRSISSTFVIDAWIKARITVAFTADAVVRKSISGSFTIDAYVPLSGTQTATIDAVVRKSVAGSFTIDALSAIRISGSFTVDAVVRASQATTFTVDAITLAAVSGTFVVDAWVKQNRVASITLDAVVKSTRTTTFTVDAWVRAVRTQTATVDAVVQAGRTSSLTADAIVHVSRVTTFTIDATTRTVGTGSFTLNATVQVARSGSATVDAYVKARLTQTYTVDAVVRKGLTSSFTLDAFVASSGLRVFTIDAVAKKDVASSFTINALSAIQITSSLTVDAVVQASRSSTLTVNAVVKASVSSSIAVDAWVKQNRSTSVTVDAVVRASVASSFTINATAKKTLSSTFAINATAQTSRSATFTIDALARRAFTGTFTVDAYILSGSVQGFSVDAVAKRAQAATFAVNAVVRAQRSATFVLDAWVRSQRTASTSLNAIVQSRPTTSFTVNAVTRATRTGGVTIDVLVRRLLTDSFAIDALVSAPSSFTIDAIAITATSRLFTVDAVVTILRPSAIGARVVVEQGYRAQPLTAVGVRAEPLGVGGIGARAWRSHAGSFTVSSYVEVP